MADLEECARDATHADLVSSYEPLGDLTLDQTMAVNTSKRAMIKRLYRRYGNDVWHACMGKCEDQDLTVFSCFGRLDLAKQVESPSTFEEFLVRNALKIVAHQLLKTQEPSPAREDEE